MTKSLTVKLEAGTVVRHIETGYTARITKTFKNGRVDMEVLTPGDESKGGFSKIGFENAMRDGYKWPMTFRNKKGNFDDLYKVIIDDNTPSNVHFYEIEDIYLTTPVDPSGYDDMTDVVAVGDTRGTLYFEREDIGMTEPVNPRGYECVEEDLVSVEVVARTIPAHGHLDSLNIRLSHERSYLAEAKTDSARQLRKVWIAQIEKEIEVEKQFLGIEDEEMDHSISDDDLLDTLLA